MEYIMEMGALICTPKKPKCFICPVRKHCLAYKKNRISEFPVKSKKSSITLKKMNYYFIYHGSQFFIQKRKKPQIWKHLYEFPSHDEMEKKSVIFFEKVALKTRSYLKKHRLSHRILDIKITECPLEDGKMFQKTAQKHALTSVTKEEFDAFPTPKPIDEFVKKKIHTKKNIIYWKD